MAGDLAPAVPARGRRIRGSPARTGRSGARTAIDPTLVARAPLLAGLLDLDIPDTDLTAGLDAKVRKASLEDLLSVVLRARSKREPLIIVLEDCHWIDELSRDLLAALGRTTAALPVLIVLAYRPSAEPGGGLGIERIPDFSELALDELAGDDALALIRSKLEQLLGSEGAAGLPEALVVARHRTLAVATRSTSRS